MVHLADLPSEVRCAYELRQIEAAGLEGGEFDEEAHDRFMAATPAMRTKALHKAEIARFLVKAGVRDGLGITKTVCDAARAKFGNKNTGRWAFGIFPAP